jgi:predicted DNA-binding protein
MSVITVRIDKALRERMKRLGHINWSEVVREAIRRRIEEEEERNLAEAVLINERLRRRAPEGWSSVEVIRRWRSLRTPR